MKISPQVAMTLRQIMLMNFGFFGIQYSFGLQQTAINPIFSFLHADPSQLPILNMAGPITGLLVQPMIGAMWVPGLGRRCPYFLIGAIGCSLCLFIYPHVTALWVAVLLLWLLDISNNTAMEPFRAFIADTVPEHQQSTGFLMQSVFTGLVLPWPTFPSISSSKSVGCNKLPKRVSRIGYSVPSILVRFALSVRFWLLFYRHPNASLVLQKWRLLRLNQAVRLMLLKILSLLYAKCRLPCGN